MTAVGTYLAGRLLGTWELYLTAIALGALVLLAMLAVSSAGRRLEAVRSFDPEEPVAGSRGTFHAAIYNRSLLPTPALHLQEGLESITGEKLELDISPLPPRGGRDVVEALDPARRGVHHLGRLGVRLTDPLGLARRTVHLGGDFTLTVTPRVAHLTSLVFFGRSGLGQLTRARLSRSHSSTDIRGVRPHQPGESLNRIDWKTTARTGVLMLRETEEPSRTDVVVVLDGTQGGDLGEPPETSFEAAVSAAGSVGDYVLREGLAVTFLIHGAEPGREVDRIDGRARGSRQMLEILAGVTASARAPLGETLHRHTDLLSRGVAVIVISPAGGRTLQSALAELVERGVPVYLVHVDALSFAGYDAVADVPLPGRPTVRPATDRGASSGTSPAPKEDEGGLDVERRRFLLGLAAAGVPSVVLRKGDSLDAVLGASGAAAGPEAGSWGRRVAGANVS